MMTLKRVNGAANPGRATVKDMGIDHRRFHIAMTQKLLNRSDVISVFKQMRGEKWRERRASRRRSSSFGFEVAPGATRGYWLIVFERIGAELASGIGFSPYSLANLPLKHTHRGALFSREKALCSTTFRSDAPFPVLEAHPHILSKLPQEHDQ
jgi:hypothetical protein